MFYALAIALCLAVLFVILACGSVLLLPAAPLAKRMVRNAAPERAANLVFSARLSPLVLAGISTLGLALPAFLKFEPHSTNEGMGLRLDVLAIAGALVLLAMLVRCWRILRATGQMQRCWRENSRRVSLPGIDLPVYRIENSPSLLAVAGIFRPRIFIGGEIIERLSPQELHAALTHEFAHISSFDNLKQLLLKITRVPSWLNPFQISDGEWTNASEIAADHNALLRGVSALDLSSALIKVARLQRSQAVAYAIASHLVPPACGSSLEHRVARLSELLKNGDQMPVRAARPRGLMLGIVLSIVVYIGCITMLLPAVHEALELLVR